MSKNRMVYRLIILAMFILLAFKNASSRGSEFYIWLSAAAIWGIILLMNWRKNR